MEVENFGPTSNLSILGLFGTSVFENETIRLNPIKDVEYDYSDLDNEIPDDVYTEDFYGDYDETFVPPPVVTPPPSNNPFGIDLNFDDYKLSDIRNIEYEYDYANYDEEEDNEIEDEPAAPAPPAAQGPPGLISEFNLDDYKLSDIKDIEYDYYDYDDDLDNEVVDTKATDIKPAAAAPALKYKYKIIKTVNLPPSNAGPVTYFTPTQLKYMGLKHQKQQQPQAPPRQRPRPQRNRPKPNILDGIVSKVQGKVNFLVGAVTRKWKFPNIFG